MEDDSKLSTQNLSQSSEDTQNKNSQSPEDIVDELIQKACLKDGSSDEEYVSAEEEDGDDNSYVIESLNENEQEKNTEQSGGNRKDEEKEEDEEKEDEEKEDEAPDEMELRRLEEESLTEEERLERQERGQTHKNSGNTSFRNGDFDQAQSEYSKALEVCPLNYHKDRAIMFANRAACEMKMDAFEEAIKDSTSAIDLHPQYLKAILRRAELYEKTEKLDEALKDYEAVLELDPGQHGARAAGLRLQEQIKVRNEKMKAEMMGKLQDLGNLVLRPFGLSTNNFKLQQDPSTGSYSVQFQQNPTGNGS